MRVTFVETRSFAVSARYALTDAELRAAQLALLDNPDGGAVIRGTHGARKLRVALPGGGKSGGARIIYVHIPRRARIYLLLAYAKNVADTVSDAGRAVLARMIRDLEAES